MIKVRQGIFETNSSSTHSITMCTASDYEKWKNGEMYYDIWDEKLVPKEDVENESEELDDDQYITYEQYDEKYCMEYETFHEQLATPNGETVIAFGYYGYGG